MKFLPKQREMILSQIVDNIEMYGERSVAAENLSYLVHCIKTIPGYDIDWRHQNQLMLCFHKLALGKGLKIKTPEFIELPKRDKGRRMSSNYEMTKFNFKSLTTIKNISCERVCRQEENKSISLPQYLSSDFIGNKIKKAENIVVRREAVNKIRNTSSKSVIRRNIFDKDKSVYKNIMVLNSGKNRK